MIIMFYHLIVSLMKNVIIYLILSDNKLVGNSCHEVVKSLTVL